MIEIDGSQGEGGGQVLRTALALSLVTQQPFTLANIRAKRSKPGLMRQHLACVQAALAVGGSASRALAQDGTPVGLGASHLVFYPGPVQAGDFTFAVGSAGSVMLVLQTVLWPLAMASRPSHLVLRGGTHNPMAPSFHYLQHMAPYLSGQDPALFTMALQRHGFYPAGGGEVHVRVQPPANGLAAIDLMQRGKPIDAWADALHAGIPRGVAERELSVMHQGLGWACTQLRNCGLRSSEGPGNVLQAVLKYEYITEVITGYGEKGVSAEEVAQKVLNDVAAFSAHQAPVGEHLADQLMIPMALAAVQGRPGKFWTTCLSEHTRTNASIIETFLPLHFDMTAAATGYLVGTTPH